MRAAQGCCPPGPRLIFIDQFEAADDDEGILHVITSIDKQYA